MPRAPSEKNAEARKLFYKGMKLSDIAKKLGVPEGTVRSWKNRGKWEKKDSQKTECNVANDETENATLQKRKKGGQRGNQNAKGGRGNPHPNPKPPPDVTKHGGYRPVFKDALDDDEEELVGMVPTDEESMLMEQIQFFSIRERRILKAINKYRRQNGDVAISDVTRCEEKRAFKDKEEETEYDKRQKIKVDKGEILPGKPYSIQTHTTNKDLIIVRLEQELSTVQGKKTKAIEVLSKFRIESARLKNENAGNEVVNDWITAALSEEGAEGIE